MAVIEEECQKARPRLRTRGRAGALVPGVAGAAALGAGAESVGRWVPVVGAPVLALLAAVLVRAAVDRAGGRLRPRVVARVEPGAAVAGRYLLQGAIVAFGAGLSLSTVARVGRASLPVMLGTLAICLAAAWLLGKLLRVPDPVRTLVGAGTGICGASAIAAVGPVVAAGPVDLAYALSTIMVYNVAAAVSFPLLGHLLGLGPHAFGLWAGTAVNDTSSVVATAYAYGPTAGDYAVVVKLTRSLMIVPLVLGLLALQARRTRRASHGPTTDSDSDSGTGTGTGAARRTPRWLLVPPFILAFLLAAGLNSAGLVPAGWHRVLPTVGGYATAAAMAAIGFGASPARLRRAGLRPLALGGLLFVTAAGSSLGLQALTGTLR